MEFRVHPYPGIRNATLLRVGWRIDGLSFLSGGPNLYTLVRFEKTFLYYNRYFNNWFDNEEFMITSSLVFLLLYTTKKLWLCEAALTVLPTDLVWVKKSSTSVPGYFVVCPFGRVAGWPQYPVYPVLEPNHRLRQDVNQYLGACWGQELVKTFISSRWKGGTHTVPWAWVTR